MGDQINSRTLDFKHNIYTDELSQNRHGLDPQ